MHSIQHYVYDKVCQIDGFLYDKTEILLKVAINTITATPIVLMFTEIQLFVI